MKSLVISLLLLVGSIAPAVAATSALKTNFHYIDIMPIQVQFRYEDSVDQSRKLHTYKGYFNVPVIELNLAYQYGDHRVSLGHSYQAEATGNQTLSLDKTKDEYLLGIGYRYFQISSSDQKLTLDLFANMFAGVTQSQVDTRFFGNSSKAKSDMDPVFAAGSSAVARLMFMVLEVDAKLLYSTNMSPQIVPAFAIRFGGSIYF